jgi:hypothetical protein
MLLTEAIRRPLSWLIIIAIITLVIISVKAGVLDPLLDMLIEYFKPFKPIIT